jgi:CubicO group peptidase (beta-lactamase class C family)
MDVNLNVSYEFKGNKYSSDEFMQRNNTTGFLVLKDGKIVYENYFLGADENSLFTSFSVGKSINSTLVGLAIGDGLIKSVNDPLVNYLPHFNESGYKDVTIKQALQMSSGVDFVEEYGLGESHFTRFFNNGLVNQSESFSEIMQSMQAKHAPGSIFNYSTGESTVLSELIYAASGKTPSDYLSEKIWSKIGMESDAYWLTDKDGMELGCGSLSITLRDCARFGQLMLNDGLYDGNQILPKGWVAEATTPDSPQVQPGKLVEGYPLGYQYQWWTFPGDEQHPYLGEGVFGQFLYINPSENIVIVKTSAWPVAWDDNKEIETYSLFQSIEEFLK